MWRKRISDLRTDGIGVGHVRHTNQGRERRIDGRWDDKWRAAPRLFFSYSEVHWRIWDRLGIIILRGKHFYALVPWRLNVEIKGYVVEEALHFISEYSIQGFFSINYLCSCLVRYILSHLLFWDNVFGKCHMDEYFQNDYDITYKPSYSNLNSYD